MPFNIKSNMESRNIIGKRYYVKDNDSIEFKKSSNEICDLFSIKLAGDSNNYPSTCIIISDPYFKNGNVNIQYIDLQKVNSRDARVFTVPYKSEYVSVSLDDIRKDYINRLQDLGHKTVNYEYIGCRYTPKCNMNGSVKCIISNTYVQLAGILDEINTPIESIILSEPYEINNIFRRNIKVIRVENHLGIFEVQFDDDDYYDTDYDIILKDHNKDLIEWEILMGHMKWDQ